MKKNVKMAYSRELEVSNAGGQEFDGIDNAEERKRIRTPNSDFGVTLTDSQRMNTLPGEDHGPTLTAYPTDLRETYRRRINHLNTQDRANKRI